MRQKCPFWIKNTTWPALGTAQPQLVYFLLLGWNSLTEQEQSTVLQETQVKERKSPVLIHVSKETFFLFYTHCQTQPKPQFKQAELALLPYDPAEKVFSSFVSLNPL